MSDLCSLPVKHIDCTLQSGLSHLIIDSIAPASARARIASRSQYQEWLASLKYSRVVTQTLPPVTLKFRCLIASVLSGVDSCENSSQSKYFAHVGAAPPEWESRTSVLPKSTVRLQRASAKPTPSMPLLGVRTICLVSVCMMRCTSPTNVGLIVIAPRVCWHTPTQGLWQYRSWEVASNMREPSRSDSVTTRHGE